MPRSPVCVFCGGLPLNREHLWPEWIRKRGLVSSRPVEQVQGQEAPASPQRREWRAPDATQRARIVCESCNGNWMSRLEGRAAPILTPLIEGHPRPLDVVEQAVIALWATKTAMTWEAISPHVRSVSPSEYEHVFKWQTPPTGWRVWIAAYTGSSWATVYFKHPLRLVLGHDKADKTPVRAEEVNGHLTTLGIQHLILQIFGTTVDGVGRAGRDHEAHFARALTSVWPARVPVYWPPDLTLTDSCLDALSNGLVSNA